jgi:hypothetical protein
MSGVRFVVIATIISLLIFACPTPDSGGGGGGTVATPSFATASGTILEQDTATIAITCATTGAAIHYTIDGSTPTGASPTYSAAIAASLFNIPSGNGTGEVKAMATLSGSSDSAVVTATYPVQDTRSPIPVISSASTGVNGDFQITVTFDEDIPLFSGNVLSLTPGTYDTIAAVSGSVYTIWIRTATFSVGNIVFNVPAGVCQDSSGNSNEISSPDFSIYYDPNAPQAVITSTASDPTNAAPIHIAISFGAINVTGFDASDLAPQGNCSITNFTTIDQAHYEADVVPAGQGSVTVDIAANVCQSQATSAWNIASAQFSRVYDTAAPNLTSVTPATGGFTATSPVLITVDWSEAVTTFDTSDITNLVNCSVSNWTAVSGSQYTFDLTPSSEAAFSFDIAAGVCTDLAGNTSTGSASWSMTYSASLPYISAISPASGGYTVFTPLPVTIDWDKTVIGFDASDIVGLTNCAVSNFTAVSATRYTFDLTPAGQGAFGFTVPAAACTDLASNPSAGPVGWSRTFDTVGPTVSAVTPATGGYTTASPFSITVDWSENVAGFNAADIGTLVNCSISNFTAVSGSQYTFDLTPSGEAAFGFTIDPSACADTAGNASTGTTVWSKTYHTTIPSISGISPATGGYATFSPIPLTIDWTEDVSNFDASDIGSLVNCSVSNFTAVSGLQYTFNLTPTGQGTFGFTVAASVCQDIAGINSTGPVSWSRTFDSSAPSVTSTTPATGGSTNSSPVNVQVDWNEAVSGFTAADIGTLVNGTVTNFTQVTASRYTFDLTPAAQSAFGFTIAASACADTAGNASTGPTTWSKTYDVTAPGVTVSTTAPDPTTTDPIPYAIAFTESVTGFTVSDITVTGGSASNFQTSNNRDFTVDIWVTGAPTANVAVTVSVAAAVCTDFPGGNDNTASLPVNANFNGTSIGFTSYQNANAVFGQANFTSNSPNQGGSVGANTYTVSYGNPSYAGGKLFLPDYTNNRVLVFNSIPATNGNADYVIGQSSLTANSAGLSSTTLNGPESVSSNGSKLIIDDYTNNRILIYNSIPSSSGAAADVVVGQTDFTTGTTGLSATKINGAESAFITSDKLLIADSVNNRVLIFNSIPTVNGAAASLVLGQTDFTSNTAGTSATTLRTPTDVWSDGTKVIVSDAYNNRILIWNTFPTSNGQAADVVVGQTDFTTSTGGTAANKFARQWNFTASSTANQLVVTDLDNHRVLVFNSIPTSNGASADVVLGQPDFTTKTAACSQNGINWPCGVSIIDNTRIMVVDANNNRALIFSGL